VGDLLVLRVGDHLAERPTGRVAHDQYGVPLLAVVGDEGGVAGAGVDDLDAVAGCERLLEGLGVPRVGLAAVVGEPEQVEHDHGAVRVAGEEGREVVTRGIHRHGPTSEGVRVTDVRRRYRVRVVAGLR
jgi:hypothetical protein